MSKRILLVGGGSGGHMYPLIAVAKSLQSKAEQEGINLDLMLMGESGFTERAAQENNIPYKTIVAGKLPRYFSVDILSNIFKIPFSFIQAFWHLFWYMPDVVFSKGGYDSVAPSIAAKIYMIPVYIHESDSVPGLSNRIIARMAKGVFIAFNGAANYFKNKNIVLVGNPTRQELFSADKASSLQYFNLSGELKTVLIIGGSQGAKILNDTITGGLFQLVEKYQIIHQCGDSQLKTVQEEVERLKGEGGNNYGGLINLRYRLFPFFNSNEMATAYAAADIVIARAGAGSLFEIAALGKPAIVVPLANAAADHQRLNAQEFANYGAALFEEPNLTPHILISQIDSFLKPENYLAVSSKIKSFATPEAADKIAEILLS